MYISYINTCIIDMPDGLNGTVVNNEDGGFTILINAKLSSDDQRHTYLHELFHIEHDDFCKSNIDSAECYAHKEAI